MAENEILTEDVVFQPERIHKENEKVAPDYSASLHAGSAIRAGGAARCSGFDIVF